MMDTIGFLGCGNMGGAIARAVCKAVDPKKVFLANRTAAKAQALAKELGCKTATNAEVAGDCDLIFLAVKPQMMEALLEPLRFTLDERPKRFVLCSMAAGLSIARIQELAGEDFPVIRIMPNTPASVGEGMIQYCSSNVTAEEEEAFLRIMAPAGRLDAVPESLIDAASCVSGCGPAWVYQFIEALADGGVACGLPRTKAQEYAAQMVLGSAKLVLESGKHPGELKDAVCSPGGSTIQGVRVLEERGLRGAVNYSTNPTRRVVCRLRFSYDEDVEKVRKIMLDVARGRNEILSSPEPSVVVEDYTDSAILITLRCWVPTEYYWDALYILNEEIVKSLKENGVAVTTNKLAVKVVGDNE